MVVGLLQLGVRAEVLERLVDHLELLLGLGTLIRVRATERLVEVSACRLGLHYLLA